MFVVLWKVERPATPKILPHPLFRHSARPVPEGSLENSNGLEVLCHPAREGHFTRPRTNYADGKQFWDTVQRASQRQALPREE